MENSGLNILVVALGGKGWNKTPNQKTTKHGSPVQLGSGLHKAISSNCRIHQDLWRTFIILFWLVDCFISAALIFLLPSLLFFLVFKILNDFFWGDLLLFHNSNIWEMRGMGFKFSVWMHLTAAGRNCSDCCLTSKCKWKGLHQTRLQNPEESHQMSGFF